MQSKNAVVVVDPMSTGVRLGKELASVGNTICVISDPNLTFTHGNVDHFTAVITYNTDSSDPDADVIEQINKLGYTIEQVIAGAEPGVNLTDKLSVHYGTLTNGLEQSEARRNKYLMGEAVREYGARVAKQLYSNQWEEIEQFVADNWGNDEFKTVVKPLDSAGSEDVYKCCNIAEVKEAFDIIHGKINLLGVRNDGIMLMEYLCGVEYVIDSVSRNGVHKTVAIWQYDKRAVNGSSFVYHGMQPRYVDSEEMKDMIDYAHAVLHAVGIANGPSHMEVIVTPTGPCLIEVGARIHGGNGSWMPISEAVYNTSMVEETINSFLFPEKFDALAPYPSKLKSHGREVFLVSRREGIIESTTEVVKFIQQLSSFYNLNMIAKGGDFVKKTTDIVSRPGSVQLLHQDKEQVDKDCETIRCMELLSGSTLMPDLFSFTRERRDTASSIASFQSLGGPTSFSDMSSMNMLGSVSSATLLTIAN